MGNTEEDHGTRDGDIEAKKESLSGRQQVEDPVDKPDDSEIFYSLDDENAEMSTNQKVGAPSVQNDGTIDD